MYKYKYKYKIQKFAMTCEWLGLRVQTSSQAFLKLRACTLDESLDYERFATLHGNKNEN
jgi:hypothetical protein